ncbi:MAG: hypothetical protein WAL36_24275, partial [Pseudolabrys sp.]
MRRREFINVIAQSAAAAAWSMAAHAQQAGPVRRIAVLMNTAANDQEGQAGLVAFGQALQQFGWAVGRNVQLDVRWGENNEDLARRYAGEL